MEKTKKQNQKTYTQVLSHSEACHGCSYNAEYKIEKDSLQRKRQGLRYYDSKSL